MALPDNPIGGIHDASSPATPPGTQDERRQPSRAETAPQKKAGRPPGPPSTIVNLRIPVDLLAQLDRYIDQLEVQTGLKANRGDDCSAGLSTVSGDPRHGAPASVRCRGQHARHSGRAVVLPILRSPSET